MRDGTATRELIDATALRLFAQQGFKETTIRDIATTAGIAEGTLYRHYESKEELAWQLFVKHNSALGLLLDDAQRPQPNTRTKISAIIADFCAFYEREPMAVEFLFFTRHGFMQRLTPRMANPYLVFRRVIRGGMNRGEISRQDPDVMTSMVMGVILQVIDTGLLSGRIKKTLSQLEDVIVSACMRVLAA